MQISRFLGLGKRAQTHGLYNPPDVDEAHKQFGANCGPASFAALARKPVIDVMPFFPHFPERRWTTLGDMRCALRTAGISFQGTGKTAPRHGFALIQLERSEGTRPVHPMAALSLTHWVAVSDDCFFDINWDGWLPKPVWTRLVFPELRRVHRGVENWSVRSGIEVSGHPEPDSLSAAVCPPTRVSLPNRTTPKHRWAVDWAATS